MRLRLIASAALLALAACSQTDTQIPTDIATWDKELAPTLKRLPEDDKALVLGYLARAKLGEAFGGEGMPVGTTIGDAIERQKEFLATQELKRAEEEALKAKMNAERAAAVELLNKAVTVTLLAKNQMPPDYDARQYSQRQEILVGVKNTGTKELVGVSGEIKFVDVFGREVGGIVIRISEKVPPGGSHVWEGGRDYNQFLPEHRAIWGLETGKYTTKFVPEMVVYADGTKVGTPS
jgi:hypothetical protein